MHLIRFFLLALLAITTSVAYAQDDARAVQRLTDLLSKTQTLTGRFSQLTRDGAGTQLQESKGSMSIKRPGLLYWHTDAPMEQLLVSNGVKVWLYDPDLQQVTVQAMDKRMTHTPALLLSGDVSKIRESFEISYKENGSIVDFILKPKAKDTLFDTLRLSFRDNIINDMQLIDSVGQRTNILFMGIKQNAAVDNAQFEFKAPAGVDVIEQ